MQIDRTRRVTTLLALTSGFLAFSVLSTGKALAVDGVIEINQASAEAGVALGDAPGFPVTLMLRGSYRLTGELSLPADTSGIVIQNDNVHIDLNGFSIVGGGGVSGDGVVTVTASPRDVRVSNGTIRNMARDGVRLGDHAVVENVLSMDNGNIGIQVGAFGRVLRSTASGSGGDGIVVAGYNGLVRDSVATNSGGNGIDTEGLCMVERSSAGGNAGDGINVRSGSRISQSSASSNQGYGIRITDGNVTDSFADHNQLVGIYSPFGSLITRSSARGNSGHGIEGGRAAVISRSSSRNNDGDGIVARDGGLVIGSVAHSNAGYGLFLDHTSGFTDNTLDDNNGGGSQKLGGQSMGTNLCGASTNCP